MEYKRKKALGLLRTRGETIMLDRAQELEKEYNKVIEKFPTELSEEISKSRDIVKGHMDGAFQELMRITSLLNDEIQAEGSGGE